MELPNTLAALHKEITRQFDVGGIDTPELDARLIIQKRTRYEWADLMSAPDAVIASAQLLQINDDFDARLTGKPLSRIYGEKEFWSLNFKVNQHTLDPRPDTEILVEAALAHFGSAPPEQILDFGTGTGCILIALLHEWSAAKGTGVDISGEALAVAHENANINGVDSRIEFIKSSWGECFGKESHGRFDLIVSNPPYISNQIIPNLGVEVREFDPILALDGGNNGLDAYKIIINDVKKLLNKRGIALFEIGYDQQKDVMRLVEDAGLFVRGVHADLAGQPRVVEISSEDK